MRRLTADFCSKRRPSTLRALRATRTQETRRRSRGRTLGAYEISQFFNGRKLVILGVWGTPGAPETLQKGGGEAPRPSEMATEATGTAQTPKTTDFRLLNNFKFPPNVQPR